ncbi:FmdB family transcriptional regulator [Saccharothrix sp. AJ9571]|nr:FmdB family transcriptional regulator [Saccharothrix sp. AJ9571]
MPTYQYACKECDHRFEAVQSFSDDSLTECPQCTGPLRKLYGAVGVIFKGSGFYRNDSRSDSKSGASSKPAETAAKSDSSSSKSDSSASSSTTSSASSSSSSSSSSTTTKTAAAS